MCVRRRETCAHSSPNQDHSRHLDLEQQPLSHWNVFKHRPVFYYRRNRSLSLELAVPLPPMHQGLAAASSLVLPRAGGWLRTRPGQGPSCLWDDLSVSWEHSCSRRRTPPRARGTVSVGTQGAVGGESLAQPVTGHLSSSHGPENSVATLTAARRPAVCLTWKACCALLGDSQPACFCAAVRE